jgi:hypothetical protein
VSVAESGVPDAPEGDELPAVWDEGISEDALRDEDEEKTRIAQKRLARTLKDHFDAMCEAGFLDGAAFDLTRDMYKAKLDLYVRSEMERQYRRWDGGYE